MSGLGGGYPHLSTCPLCLAYSTPCLRTLLLTHLWVPNPGLLTPTGYSPPDLLTYQVPPAYSSLGYLLPAYSPSGARPHWTLTPGLLTSRYPPWAYLPLANSLPGYLLSGMDLDQAYLRLPYSPEGPGTRHTQPPCGQTHASQTINFPQLRWRVVYIKMAVTEVEAMSNCDKENIFSIICIGRSRGC